jgi:hypothetical protein
LELVAEIEHLALRDAATLIAQQLNVVPRSRARGHSQQQKGHHAMSGKPSHKVFVVENRPGAGDDDEAF